MLKRQFSTYGYSITEYIELVKKWDEEDKTDYASCLSEEGHFIEPKNETSSKMVFDRRSLTLEEITELHKPYNQKKNTIRKNTIAEKY